MSKSILLRTANRRPLTAVSGLPFNDENVKLNLSSIGGNALIEGVAVMIDYTKDRNIRLTCRVQ